MASLKPNGTWLARVRTSEGRVSHVFPTMDSAERWEKLAKQAVKDRLPVPSPVDTGGEMIADFFPAAVEYLWRDAAGLHNLRAQARRLCEELGPRAVGTITQKDAVLVRQRLLEAGLSASSINNYAACFNRIMKHAHQLGHVPELLKFEYARQARGKFRWLSDAEEERLVKYFDHIGREDYADFITFLIYTGARYSEAVKLQWEDVKADRVTFWETKDGLMRTVPLAKRAQAALQRRRGMSGDLVKPFPFAYSTVKQALEKACRFLELDDITFHTCRHTTASRLVQKGVDIRRVKDFMGHSSINTTMIYAHLSPKDLFLAAEALDG